jgi:hypothetical protein
MWLPCPFFSWEDEMKLLVGGLIALILLFLYVYSVVRAVILALSDAGGTLNSGELLALTTIGGLVSALVIAELAIMKPGETPAVHTLGASGENLSRAAQKAAPWVVGLYMLVWTLLGLAAFIVGVMQFPGKVQPLTDLGQSWLGLAVAAGYAYFGLNKDEGEAARAQRSRAE